MFALVSLTQKSKVPAKFELIAGEKGEPEPIMGGFPTEGSLSYQFKVPPDPFAVKLGITSPTHIDAGELALGATGAASTIMLKAVGILSQPVALVSVTQKVVVAIMPGFTGGLKGFPVLMGGTPPPEGSLLYQLIVPPLPVAETLGTASFKQIISSFTTS